jgi:XrtN system VIT domain protein
MKEPLFRDTQFKVGVIWVLISFVIYLSGLGLDGERSLWIFFINYIFTAVYFGAVILTALFSRKDYRFFRIFPALVLSLISAYSLNRSMNIFDASPLWLSITLVLVSVACLGLAFFRNMPHYLRYLTMAVTGAGMVVFLYLSIYLAPVYPLSGAIFWVLGISLHSFVPLLFLIFLVAWLIRYNEETRKTVRALVAGAGLTLVAVTVFTIRWAGVVNTIDDTYRESFVEDNTALPNWVRVSQRLPKNNITNKALKVGLTYLVPDFDSWDFSRFSNSRRFTDRKIHDPFVVIACLIAGEPSLGDDEKIHILESIYDCRHQATERLWSDEGIKTTYVNSTVLIWPQYRTSYTEQVIMLRNTEYSWRGGEAVYTFHLPEGSVVTSLSLWVNGQEEKGILTTKAKADSAYRTIVGVESRDPSLVHWQEGSTVTVRVFPITEKEERTFKIGITSPLHKRGDQLMYEPVYFEGTDHTKAKEVLNVQFMQAPEKLNYPSFFTKEDLELVSGKKTRYNNHWAITMKDPGLSGQPFCFDGNCYSLQELQPQEVPVEFREIYLDVNGSWTKSEFNAVLEAAGNRKVCVFDGQEMKTVQPENKNMLYNRLSKLQFSLFPVHLVEQPGRSLLVSKSTPVSPNIADLKDSRFFKALRKSARHDRAAVYFYNLGDELPSYLKTLREFRLLNYQRGDVAGLKTMIDRSVFLQTSFETDSCVAVHDAGINIIKQKSRGKTVAPDHLMRLFAYNHIMLQYAGSWNEASPLTDSMVAEARQAYVVSPVSSLVVLETQKDYDRFDIRDTENSLKNASKSSNGAVPEPHEWALIAIAGMVAAYLYLRRRTKPVI